MKIARLILIGLVAICIAAPRLAANHWTVYGPWLASLAAHLAQIASPSQRIVVVGTSVFTPRAEAHVNTSCDGFDGIRIFSILCGVVFLLNWRHTGKFKLLGAYVTGVALLWCHNLARIVAAIVQGGETHYGTSELSVLALAIVLAVLAIRMRPAHATVC